MTMRMSLRLVAFLGMLATSAWDSPAAEIIAVTPMPADEIGATTLPFYDSVCDPNSAVECVVFALSCEESSFEITFGILSNAEIAEWITANRDGDTISEGRADLIVSDVTFPLYPSTMAYSDMNGNWEVSLLIIDGATMAGGEAVPLGTEVAAWSALAAAPQWSLSLGNNRKSFAVDEVGRARVQGLAKTCQSR